MGCEPQKGQKEHQWLMQLLGEWAYETEMIMEPGKPPMRCTGTERVRALGDLWVLCEGEGKMPDGGTGSMLMTLGYDPAKGRYVGSWTGSMMTHMFVYTGILDASEKSLTLDTEGPSWTAEGKTSPYQDVIQIIGADHRMLRSRSPGEDGTWREFMTAHYRRQ